MIGWPRLRVCVVLDPYPVGTLGLEQGNAESRNMSFFGRDRPGIDAGCGGDSEGPGPRVVVYSSLDREFSEPLLKDYASTDGRRGLAQI